jgi:hypothetical protein
MNEEKIEEILKRRDESMQRYIAGLIEESDRKTGALSEEFQSRLSTVAEGITILNEKVDRIETTQNAHTEMIGIIAEDVAVLKDDVTILKDGVSEIKTELKNKVSRPEFIELKQTVLAMS